MKKGHNSIAPDQLKSIVERIENVSEEIAGLNDDRKEIYAEAKGNGFDTKAIRRLIARRKLDAQEAEERDTMDELYRGVFE